MKEGKGFILEYDNINKEIFEGEYLNGKRNGKGKVYDYEGGLIYEGEYSDGKRINGIEYEGNIKQIKKIYEFNNGKRFL